MHNYLIFIMLCAALLLIAYFTRKKGYYNLNVYRKIPQKHVMEGENLNITIVVENNKWLPVSFLNLMEPVPIGIEAQHSETDFEDRHITRYNILWYERIKRTYSVVCKKRGTYLFRNIEMTLGDIFGFAAENKTIEDYFEILVYPKLIDLKHLSFENNNLMGDSIVRRWIHKDPLYIKGIREYSSEDRMKDIHWKSSLKMNRLMVKDYDYTSDNEVIIISNLQIDEPYWDAINSNISEMIIRVSASIAAEISKAHVPVGMWTNAHVKSYTDNVKSEVAPSLNSLKGIIELSARMDIIPRESFKDYLMRMMPCFSKNCTYILVAAFLAAEDVNMLIKLKRYGINIKLVDITNDSSLPEISGISKTAFKWGNLV